jgi:hypothetical protein
MWTRSSQSRVRCHEASNFSLHHKKGECIGHVVVQVDTCYQEANVRRDPCRTICRTTGRDRDQKDVPNEEGHNGRDGLMNGAAWTSG